MKEKYYTCRYDRPFKEIMLKESNKDGLIYQIDLTSSNIKELNSAIIYLKQKGYEIISLDDLLKE